MRTKAVGSEPTRFARVSAERRFRKCLCTAGAPFFINSHDPLPAWMRPNPVSPEHVSTTHAFLAVISPTRGVAIVSVKGAVGLGELAVVAFLEMLRLHP